MQPVLCNNTPLQPTTLSITELQEEHTLGCTYQRALYIGRKMSHSMKLRATDTTINCRWNKKEQLKHLIAVEEL